jgi:hypothetical protein
MRSRRSTTPARPYVPVRLALALAAAAALVLVAILVINSDGTIRVARTWSIAATQGECL